MASNGQNSLANAAVASVRVLWGSPTPFDFNINLEHFTALWTKDYAPFLCYFNKTWIESFPPSQWAYYGRGAEFHSGKHLNIQVVNCFR
jgi:hypothetical protein